MKVVQFLTTSPPTTSRMDMRPGARFGIANALLVVAFLIASAGLLGAGLALSLSMTATLGIVAWGGFTGFIQPGSGELTFAGDDVQRLLVFTVSTVALAVFMGRIHHVIKENSHG